MGRRHRVSTDERGGTTNDPNRADDPEYIVRLIGQAITVSLGNDEDREGAAANGPSTGDH